MIAVGNQLPHVPWKEDRNIPLSEGWIAESLEHSARLAGLEGWQWSAEVARAIVHFLQRDYHQPLISVEELTLVLERSLTGIGYPEVARHAQMVAPRVNIYLPDLARQAPYELLFFTALRERLQEARHVIVRGVKLEGLRTCVKMLRSRKRWRSRCESLGDEIVLFSRQQLASGNPAGNPVELVIHG